MARPTTRSILVAAAGLSLGACIQPRAVAPTVEHQRRVLDLLNAGYTADLALLAAQLDAAIEIRRILMIGRIERRLIDRGYLADNGPDLERLNGALADPRQTDELIADIRLGRLSEPQAAELLHNLALAARMTGDDGRALRGSILSRLDAVRQFDQAAVDLRAAVQARTRAVAHLFADLGESTDTLGRYAAFSPNNTEAAPLLWNRAVLDHIDDPAKRQATSDLLNQLLALTAAR